MVLNSGARLARSFPTAIVHVVHVFRTSRFDRARAGTQAPAADAIADAKEHLEFHVRSARKVCRNDVRGHFLIGDPVAEVKKLATEIKADLLVVGTHDHTGFERFLLGSIAETLMRQVGCSVYVVRPAPHRD
jgi:nucleotide-binding universal stress UspA family protein